MRRGLLLCIVVLGACAPGAAPTPTPTVHSVVDGDTMIVTFGSRREIVRLLGIDTPESVDPNRPVQCFGAEASSRLAELAPIGSPLRLERDAEARDRYGRLLAYLHVDTVRGDEVFVNEVLLAEGYAALSIYEPNVAHRQRLARAETRARTAQIGLWDVCGGPDTPVDPPPVTAPE